MNSSCPFCRVYWTKPASLEWLTTLESKSVQLLFCSGPLMWTWFKERTKKHSEVHQGSSRQNSRETMLIFQEVICNRQYHKHTSPKLWLEPDQEPVIRVWFKTIPPKVKTVYKYIDICIYLSGTSMLMITTQLFKKDQCRESYSRVAGYHVASFCDSDKNR